MGMLRHDHPCFTRYQNCWHCNSCVLQSCSLAVYNVLEACPFCHDVTKGTCLPNSALAPKAAKGTCLPTVCAEPLSQLEAEVKKQAHLIVNLQSAALANSRAHNELVQHFQHLRAHVRRNTKSQQLLQDLSGVGAVMILQ